MSPTFCPSCLLSSFSWGRFYKTFSPGGVSTCGCESAVESWHQLFLHRFCWTRTSWPVWWFSSGRVCVRATHRHSDGCEGLLHPKFRAASCFTLWNFIVYPWFNWSFRDTLGLQPWNMRSLGDFMHRTVHNLQYTHTHNTSLYRSFHQQTHSVKPVVFIRWGDAAAEMQNCALTGEHIKWERPTFVCEASLIPSVFCIEAAVDQDPYLDEVSQQFITVN